MKKGFDLLELEPVLNQNAVLSSHLSHPLFLELTYGHPVF